MANDPEVVAAWEEVVRRVGEMRHDFGNTRRPKAQNGAGDSDLIRLFAEGEGFRSIGLKTGLSDTWARKRLERIKDRQGIHDWDDFREWCRFKTNHTD